MKINLCDIQFNSLINLLNLQAATIMSLLNSNKVTADLMPDENDSKKITLRLHGAPEEERTDVATSIDLPLTTSKQKDDFMNIIKHFETLNIESDKHVDAPTASCDINQKVVDSSAHEYTVDGLKLKSQYVAYYKCLKILVDFLVMYVSKEVSMKEYDQVYSLGRQLYELLRGIFVDEPFKLWLERNTHEFDNNKDEILKTLQNELKVALGDIKTCTFKDIVTNLLNTQLYCKHDCVDEYIKPNCIVDTYNCCNLIYKKET
ncbi:Mv-ORF57 peptide [Maruca vitrata nucleopolyhedrovirus]|uniref:Mv-ORF57 peptide n=1 Tax=Maruca vitrata nucleopolyhedrovirus TaxID=1307954 RepID=A1YRB9_9ABAC|nr:Mv-ORF57 peptide [Maruca vitrata nucleopolyhedrovirus]ABL76009.1 Mv-ORF57 peptide [Maruca vitrata nucleopolyhedrovirus]